MVLVFGEDRSWRGHGSSVGMRKEQKKYVIGLRLSNSPPKSDAPSYLLSLCPYHDATCYGSGSEQIVHGQSPG